jgi:hypothetical protein
MPSSASAQPAEMRPRALTIVFLSWLSLAFLGMAGLWRYSTAPGEDGSPPARWPASSTLRRAPRTSTLLMFVHPKCPCSRASIGELAVLLAHSAGRLQAQVVFLQPHGKADSWIQSDLWQAASKLPGTMVISDLDGREAEIFQATVSGDTAVYDAAGNLKFHGGITGARGHRGDNPGRAAVASYANNGASPLARTPVFGCPLFNEPACQTP